MRGLAALLAAAALAGCGGGGDDGVQVEPTLASIQQQVFTPSCALAPTCHAGATPAGLLDLSAAAARANLVDVDSTELAGRKRVAPGDAAASWIITKLEPGPPEGDRMPQSGAPLDPAVITVIRAWIDAGAP